MFPDGLRLDDGERKRWYSDCIQLTDKWGVGGDNVTGQVTTPGSATLLTSPQNYRDTHETGHGEKS